MNFLRLYGGSEFSQVELSQVVRRSELSQVIRRIAQRESLHARDTTRCAISPVLSDRNFYNASFRISRRTLKFCALLSDPPSGSAHVAAGQSVRRPREARGSVEGSIF